MRPPPRAALFRAGVRGEGDGLLLGQHGRARLRSALARASEAPEPVRRDALHADVRLQPLGPDRPREHGGRVLHHERRSPSKRMEKAPSERGARHAERLRRLLDPDTYKITLEPGTYLIEGSCLHAGTTKSACRLIKLKSDGSYDSTLALGTIGMSRANGNTGNTYFSSGLSTFPPTEVVVTEQTQILVHQFFWNGAAVNGGPANQGGDRQITATETALGTSGFRRAASRTRARARRAW